MAKRRKGKKSSSTASPSSAAAATDVTQASAKDEDGPNEIGEGDSRGWSSLPWSSVPVTLGDPDDSQGKPGKKRSRPLSLSADDSDDEYLSAPNHYDTYEAFPSRTKSALRDFDDDLYDPLRDTSAVPGANDPGLFVNLEVVDGSLFTVEKVRDRSGGCFNRIVFKKTDGDAGGKKKEEEGAGAKAEGKKGGDGNKKEPPNGQEKDKAEGKASSSSSKAAKNRKRKEKRKAKKKAAIERKRRQKLEKEREGQAEASTTIDVPSDVKGPQEEVRADDAPPKSAAAASKDNFARGHPTQEQVTTLQTNWSAATSGVYLPHSIASILVRLGYTHPTPIQAATLGAALLGRRDVVGAAPTGSGKTCAYALPIVHCLLEGRDEVDGERNDEEQERPGLTALIMCPTRELALQVSAEFNKLCEGYDGTACGTIVGGLAEVKQRRVLDVKRPPVIVGTPGRLWELMSSGDHPHLCDLTSLRYLVVDEADRMISQGSFPQLSQIFDAINRANPPQPDPEEELRDDEVEEEDGGRLKSLRGVRGEAKVEMLNDEILEMIERQRHAGGDCGEDGGPSLPEAMELEDDEYFAQQAKLLDSSGSNVDESSEEGVDWPGLHRQTFVYSATLTLPPQKPIHKGTTKVTKKNGRNNKSKPKTVDGAIAEILERAGARGQTKIVDLTSRPAAEQVRGVQQNKQKPADAKASPSGDGVGVSSRLPRGLTLQRILCTKHHKDSHLYAYLTTTPQGSKGPALVFCNSVSCVKRVGEILKVLGLDVKTLHAQMTQKARLGALESLSGHTPNHRSIVVATDVAARGLDVPCVSTVVHYDTARAVDTFIHRAGRTARGVGENAVGVSLSLVSPSEEAAHRRVCDAILAPEMMLPNMCFRDVPIDGRLLTAAQERTNLASKIVDCERVESKASKENKWFIAAASDAGLDLEEELLDQGLLGGDKRDRQRLLEAKRARKELSDLLSKPMRKQNFGKFLSDPGIQEAMRAEREVKPYVVHADERKNEKRKKRKISQNRCTV